MAIKTSLSHQAPDAQEVRKVKERILIDHIKKNINNIIFSHSKPAATRDQLARNIQACLHSYVNNGNLHAFLVEVDLHASKLIKEVNVMPATSLPGDPLITEAGTENESYAGIVLSNDGDGNGVIFQNKPSSEFHVTCWLQASPIVDYIVLNIVHDDI